MRMEKSSFGVKRCLSGFFLYYKGHFLGGRVCGQNDVHTIAEGEINEILAGSGWVGYMAVIRSIDGAKRKEAQLCLF